MDFSIHTAILAAAWDSCKAICEKVGELAREINHIYGPKKKKSTEETKEMADEIADIIFTLSCLANSQKSVWMNHGKKW